MWESNYNCIYFYFSYRNTTTCCLLIAYILKFLFISENHIYNLTILHKLRPKNITYCLWTPENRRHLSLLRLPRWAMGDTGLHVKSEVCEVFAWWTHDWCRETGQEHSCGLENHQRRQASAPVSASFCWRTFANERRRRTRPLPCVLQRLSI